MIDLSDDLRQSIVHVREWLDNVLNGREVKTEAPAETTGIGSSRSLVSLDVPGNAAKVVVATGDNWRGQEPFEIQLTRKGPGDIILTLTIAGTRRMTVPLDNFIKAAVRLDPDYATGTEREIVQLQYELAKSRATVLEHVVKINQLEDLHGRVTRD